MASAHAETDRIDRRKVKALLSDPRKRSDRTLDPQNRAKIGSMPLTIVFYGNVYRASRDLFLAQRFARHVSPLTTVVYTHPSDEELREGVRELRC